MGCAKTFTKSCMMPQRRLKKMVLRRGRAIRRSTLKICVLAVLLGLAGRYSGPTLQLARLLQGLALQRLARATELITHAAPRPFHIPASNGFVRLLSVVNNDAFGTVRFMADDVGRLAAHFLPETITTLFRHGKIQRVDAMALLLARLATPAYYSSLSILFGWPDSKISDVLHSTAPYLVNRWFACLETPPWLTSSCLRAYNAVINSHGLDDPLISGFLDGTRREICRPRVAQEFYYNGWLHSHTFLLIAIAFPDGTFMIRGAEGGRQNDPYILSSTGLNSDLNNILHGFAVGADAEFSPTPNIRSIQLYQGALFDVSKSETYSRNRICVEWLFSIITGSFRYFQCPSEMKIDLTIPVVLYKAAAILALARNALYPSQIAQYFGLTPSRHLATYFPPN